MRATVRRHAQKAAPAQKVLGMSLLCHHTDSDRCRELFPTTSCKPLENEICFPMVWALWGKECMGSQRGYVAQLGSSGWAGDLKNHSP